MGRTLFVGPMSTCQGAYIRPRRSQAHPRLRRRAVGSETRACGPPLLGGSTKAAPHGTCGGYCCTLMDLQMLNMIQPHVSSHPAFINARRPAAKKISP